MAAKFPSTSDVQLKPRKGHDMAWSCDDHGEPIKFFCKGHKIPLCQPCAIKDHQKPCHLDNIGDVILEMGSKLEDKLLELEEMMQRSKKLNSEIQSCSTFMSNHLETVNDEVNIAYEDKIKIVKDKEQEEILLINDEADDQIRIINETRETRVKSSREEAEKKQRSLEDTQAQLLSDNKNIDATVGKKIKELKSKNQHIIDTMDNISSKIKRINQDDKALVNKAPQVIASLDGSVSENVHQHILDSLDHLKLEVQRVKFVEGKIGGDDYARIDGYIGKWEVLKISIVIPPIVKSPYMRGLISNDELCVLDSNNNDLYISNISNGHTHKVIKGDIYMSITSCAPVDSNLIVCGKNRRHILGDRLHGYITLYDRQWKLVRDITIPRNTSKFTSTMSLRHSAVSVDVDKDGMILAAEFDQPNIYVINPADSKIVHTITMQGKKMIGGRIQALSSGDIIVHTEKDEFTVISRSGEEKAVIHGDEWNTPYCRIDKLTDTLYITYWAEKNRIHAVDQVSFDGSIQARRIVEYKISDRCRYPIPCNISPSGNLTTLIGEIIFTYKKRFVV